MPSSGRLVADTGNLRQHRSYPEIRNQLIVLGTTSKSILFELSRPQNYVNFAIRPIPSQRSNSMDKHISVHLCHGRIFLGGAGASRNNDNRV